MGQPTSDTWLGAAFLALHPGPLYYLYFLVPPLTVLFASWGATHAGEVLAFVARLGAVQVGHGAAP